MKQLFFTFFALILLTTLLHAQTTYYYVGGAGPVNISLNTNWSTVQNNSDAGNLRTGSATATDILVIDGTNIGGNTVTTGPATIVVNSTTACGQIKLQNNATLILKRLGGGTGNLNISGDGTPLDDLLIPAGCSLTMNSTSTEGSVNMIMGVSAGPAVTGRIGGTVTFTSTGSHRLACFTVGGLIFESGSICNSDVIPASSSYIFGSGSTQAALLSVVFQSGSSLIHTGKFSPLGNTAGIQVIDFLSGSNFYFRTSNVAGNGSYANGKYFSNFYVQNNSTFTADGTVFKFDKLIVEAGSTYITHTTGSTPVTDTLRVEGTLMATSGTNALILGGAISRELPSPSGIGTINVPTLVASELSHVTLRNNINVTTSCVLMDSFNFKTFQITGTSGTPTFTARGIQAPNTNYTGSTTAGSLLITVGPSAPSGLNGLTISGPGIQSGTVVLAFASGGSVYLSKPATATATGVQFTFSTASPATLRTANPNGFDDATGSVVVPGTKTYNSGINYVFDAATTKPFSTATFTGTMNNLTVNAPITTNLNLRVNGLLTMNTGNINIRPTDNIIVSASGSISGGGPSKYFVIEKDATNSGVLTKTGFSAATLFPVGTSAHYMPVTLEPQANPADFSISVFEGITNEGTVSGTPFTAGQKADVVDAVWVINRATGSLATDPCSVTISWDASLEGSNFAAFPNAEVGITHHNGTIFEPATGAGNNTTNTATAIFASFSPFGIAHELAVVPVQFISVNAAYHSGRVNVSWKIANDETMQSYYVEKADDRLIFTSDKSIASRHETGNAQYDVVDANPFNGNNYYRIRGVGLNGEVKYSSIAKINVNAKSSFSVLQNPVQNKLMQINMSGLAAGKYRLSIANTAGQVVYTTDLQYNGGITSNSINLPVSLSKGLFTVILRNGNDTRSINVIVE